MATLKKREPLREVNRNLHNQQFQIFNDNVPDKKTSKISPKNADVATLEAIIKLQGLELKRLRLKCSFLEFVNQVKKQQKARPAVVPSSATPKKRRLESPDVGDDDDSLEYSQGSPARALTSVLMTPVSILKSGSKNSSSASLLRQFAQSPNATPLARATKGGDSVPNRKISISTNGIVPLIERLKSMDDGVRVTNENRPNGADDVEDVETVFEESVKEKTVTDSKPTNKGMKRQPAHPPSVPAPSIPVTVPPESQKKDTVVEEEEEQPKPKPVSKAQASNYREAISIPVVREHTTFRDVIAEATSSSIKTFYSRQQHRTDRYKSTVRATAASTTAVVTPPSGGLHSPNEDLNSIKDTLARYRRNNEKLATEELQQKFYHLSTDDTKYITPVKEKHTVSNDMVDATKDDRMSLLERSVLNYHHTVSVVTPLTALGQQSLQSPNGTPAVALTNLTALQSQMSSWKDKYQS